MNNSKGKILYIFFIILILVSIGFGVYYALNNINAETHEFKKDGYALYVNEGGDFKSKNYSFKSGTEYSYKKLNNKITFDSSDGNAKIDESTVIHYTDNSILLLKNVVGLDLNTINQNIIFYYNIYKNNEIKKDNSGFFIETYHGEKITFKDMLIRINDTKYLFMGNNIRLTLSTDDVIDFGNYVYFEFVNGSIIRIYNNTKNYQTIKENASLLCDDIIINLSDKTIAKGGKKYITLSNLVIDNDNNIDIITETDVASLPDISKSNIVIKKENETNSETNNNTVSGDTAQADENDDTQQEEVEDKTANKKTPTYKVVKMEVTPIQFDSEIEITDEDGLIVSDTKVTIVNNANLKTVYEQSVPAGDTSIFVSTAALDPDTEYTMYAKAKYSINDVEYEKTFISKIFRTEALGVSMKKNYATSDSISIVIDKESYSKVSSLTLNIYNSSNEKIDYKTIDFTSNNKVEVVFSELSNNSNYTIIMTDIMCDGVVVKDGYSIREIFTTLKLAPSIGKLNYLVDKRDSNFELSASSIKDDDLGIKSYRYEIFNTFQDINNDKPLLTITSKDANPVKAPIDGVKLERGKTYTYKLVLVFDDNEKIVEYSKELGTTMQMDGVEFPKIRFEKTNVTWEQIKGTIIVEDKSNTIVGDNYRVVYKNSVDSYLTNVITVSTSVESIPINVDNLRANETYTFQVYADVNLKDGNETIKEAYIGSVYVQTEKPQHLKANFESTTDYNSAFSVLTRLTSVDGQDARLEASTLSEVTLTLFQGSNVNGAKEVYKKVVDLNDKNYESTIKDNFFDQSTAINPTFFDANNNDFTERTYTLQITDAYDYTTYKNEIPIDNNTFTFNINSFVPDVPDDTENAIKVTEIKNSAADMCNLEFNNNLNSNTTVCYALKTNYYDTADNATRLVYHTYVYNQLTKEYELLSDLDKSLTFDENGDTEALFLPLDMGTSNTVFDNDKLRRGNKYYFTYEVYLDMDGDGNEDGVYPRLVDENIVLKSPVLNPKKQTASYVLYPSQTGSKKASWKYKIVDVDHAMESNKLYSFVGNKATPSSAPSINISNEYELVSFSNLTNGNFYSIKSLERLIKSDEANYKTLSNQYLDNLATSLNLTYTVSIENDSSLNIEIDNYYSGNNSDIVEKIANADVILKAKNSSLSKTITNCQFENGKIGINLVDISEFKDIEFTVDVNVYFDSGNAGFDVPSDYKALQNVTLDGTGSYYVLNDKGELSQNSIIENSKFTTIFKPLELLLSITNSSSISLNMNVSIDESGVVYNRNNIVLKELKKQLLNVQSAENKNASFSILLPSISLVKDNKLDIISLLSSVKLNAKLSIANGVVVQNDKVYIDLYSTNENGTNMVFIKTIEKNISDFSSAIEIDSLNPKSHYAVQFYVYLYNDKTKQYFKSFLYDVDDKTVGKTYKFSTLADVGIDNIQVTFNAESYNNKKIDIKYSLESLFGYDHIEYKVYEENDGEYTLVDSSIPNSIAFWNNMSLSTSASPGNTSGYTYGKKYKLVITAIAYYEINGERNSFELGTGEKLFSIPEVQEPQIGISPSKTDNSISFKVSINDSSKVIKDEVYSIKLVDSKNNVLASNTNLPSRTINKKFEFDKDTYNLKDGEIYSLLVSVETDLLNDGKTFSEISNKKSVVFGNNLSLGSITASKDDNIEGAIDIIFSDSYLLNTIDRITYSVRSSSVDYFSTNSVPFTTTYDPAGNIYMFVMPVDNNSNFAPGNVYTITMNFYTDGELVEQEEISYYYRRDN